MIARHQIFGGQAIHVEMTKRTGELVASNKAGVAPLNPKHVRRFKELKAEYEEARAKLLKVVRKLQRLADEMKEAA